MFDVIFVIGTLDVGGAERHLSYLLPELARRQMKVLLFVMNKDGPLRSVFESAGVPVVIGRQSLRWIEATKQWIIRHFPPKTKTPSVFVLNVIQFSWNFSQFCRLLLANRKAILHCFLPGAVIYGGAAALCVFHRNRISSRRSLNLYQLKRPFFGRVDRFFTASSRVILGNSQAVVEDLIAEGQPRSRVRLIYNGIPVHHSTPSIPKEGWVMTLVANLIPYKGHLDLLHALGKIQGELPENWEIRFAGTGSDEYKKVLLDCAQDLGVSSHIRWLGSVREISTLYGESHLSLLVSHEEGFSNSILEAMDCAQPMVVTRVGGNAEAVLNGETGWVVAPRNPDELAAAILSASQMEPSQLRDMGLRARERLKKHFSLDACAGNYISLYNELGRSIPNG